MKTIVKNKTVRPASRSELAQAKKQQDQVHTNVHIAVDQIDPSPFNHRRIYVKKKLEELAASLKNHGMLHALIVRPKEDGRYELVTGERRIRAAKIIKFASVPCMVRVLTDQQVKEIQLLENLQRENPHPLEDCWSILQMQEEGKSITEIAAVLGKSKAFVFGRIQLTKLTQAFHEPFLEDKFTLTDALAIAELSAESQQEIFDGYGTEWKDQQWDKEDLLYAIDRYQCDLTRAPFNVKDKKLDPEMGACQGCAFNSATYRSLFPEMDKKATCSNKACFKNKCLTATANLYRKAVADHQPQAILHYGYLSSDLCMLLDSLEETAGLPRFFASVVDVIHEPEKPKREQYLSDGDSEGSQVFDEQAYNDAVTEYDEELTDFNEAIAKEGTQKGILIRSQEVFVCYFAERERTHAPALGTVTAKEVQEALKEGSATPELLQKEINRITEKEKRSAVLDKIKIQEKIHMQFLTDQEEPQQKPTAADLAALRLIVYQSLSHRVQSLVDEQMMPQDISYRDHEKFLQALAALTDEQFSFLIRMSLAGDPNSKTPGNITAHAFYRMAEEAGTDVAGIEAEQADISQKRIDKAALKIKDMQTRIERLKQKEMSASQVEA